MLITKNNCASKRSDDNKLATGKEPKGDLFYDKQTSSDNSSLVNTLWKKINKKVARFYFTISNNNVDDLKKLQINGSSMKDLDTGKNKDD